MQDRFSDTIQKCVANLVSDMTDKEIDNACEDFRKKMLSKKPEIVNKIIDGFRFVVKQDGIDGITVQIHMR